MKKSILNVSLDAGCATSPAGQQHRTRQYMHTQNKMCKSVGSTESTNTLVDNEETKQAKKVIFYAICRCNLNHILYQASSKIFYMV